MRSPSKLEPAVSPTVITVIAIVAMGLLGYFIAEWLVRRRFGSETDEQAS